MLDKNNEGYRLYLAGLISESKYYDLCEGIGDELESADDIKLKQATAKFKNFMSTFEDIGNITPETAGLLLEAFLSAFLDHVRTVNPSRLRKILADAIEKHKNKLQTGESETAMKSAVLDQMDAKKFESVLEHSDGNDMLKRNLMDICDHSKMILSLLQDDDVIEEWMRYKISVSNSSMSDVAHAFKHRKRDQMGCGANESAEEIDPVDAKLESDWKREEKLIQIGDRYLSSLSRMIARGDYSHPDFQDEGEVPEIRTWHGEGEPDKMKEFLRHYATKMPRELASKMLKEIESV